MEWYCKKCDGMGIRVVERADGGFLAEDCECRALRRNVQLHSRSGIPERYRDCTLQNYVYDFPGAHGSLQHALFQASRFAGGYPHDLKGTGLLFTGDIGTGKTHLAVAILQALTLEKGVPALFCDHRELMKAIHNSYNPRVASTEMEVLRPVFEAEVLVLDELGSAKKTEWVSDMVEHILNTRYNSNRTTIVTTNYPNLPPGGMALRAPKPKAERPFSAPAQSRAEANRPPVSPKDATFEDIQRRMDMLAGSRTEMPGLPTDRSRSAPGGLVGTQERPFADRTQAEPSPGDRERMGAEFSAAGITLGDRIGERMRSRLMEMCVTVELRGSDYRQGAKKAQFR